MPMSERQLQARVIDTAKNTGWLYYFTYNSQRSPAGFPDLCLVRDCECLMWELKSARRGTKAAEDNQDVRPLQKEWLRKFAKVPGIEARVIRPDDLPYVDARLSKRPGSGPAIIT